VRRKGGFSCSLRENWWTGERGPETETGFPYSEGEEKKAAEVQPLLRSKQTGGETGDGTRYKGFAARQDWKGHVY